MSASLHTSCSSTDALLQVFLQLPHSRAIADFNHNAGPTLSIALPPGKFHANVTQDLGAATLTHTLASIDGGA